MIPAHLIGELEFVLFESAGRFNVDMDAYEDDLREKIQDLYDWSERRNGKDGVGFEPKDEFKVRRIATFKNMHKIGGGLSRILSKIESDVNLTIRPQYSDDGLMEPVKSAYVMIHKGGKPSRASAGFTYFGPREIDDVLDAGDAEFFRDQDIEIAYFQLVNEIRNPGSTTKSGKPTKVYTARPAKDRKIYDGAKAVPSGIYVTNDPDRAEGFGREFGGTEGRDLWRIVIDSKHLVQTLKAGRTRDYQVVGKGKVPVKSIKRLS